MKPHIKAIIYLLLPNIFFVVVLFLLRHAWDISELESESAKEIYPRLHLLVVLIGEKSALIFTVLSGIIIVANGSYVVKIIVKCKGKKIALLFFFSVALMLVLAEVILRISGFEPGFHTSSIHFKPVDELLEYKGFIADENGIFKIDSVAAKEVAQRIAVKKEHYTEEEAFEIYNIIEENIEFINGNNKNQLYQTYMQIQSKPEQTLTDFDKGILHYIENPINSDGFKSILFQSYKSNKPSVLLLGDSFTWGHSASLKANCFADILLSNGYVVYNTGISGSDVAQYLAIAQKYIPELKPDFVIVNFYLGNDITYYKREPLPYQKIFYATKSGNLFAYPQGEYLKSKEDAYRFVLSQWTIPQQENLFNRAMAQTSFSTLVWKVMYKLDYFPYLNKEVFWTNEKAKKCKYPKPYSDIELREIKKIAQENGSRLIISSIPDVYRFSKKTAKDFPDLFEGIEYLEMEVEKDDYKLDDGHFNDQGHEKYANFLDSLIQSHQ